MACARLHNSIKEDCSFEQNLHSVEDKIEDQNFDVNPSNPFQMSYQPVIPDETFQVYHGKSHTREAVVEFLRVSNVLQPVHNVNRKKETM